MAGKTTNRAKKVMCVCRNKNLKSLRADCFFPSNNQRIPDLSNAIVIWCNLHLRVEETKGQTEHSLRYKAREWGLRWFLGALDFPDREVVPSNHLVTKSYEGRVDGPGFNNIGSPLDFWASLSSGFICPTNSLASEMKLGRGRHSVGKAAVRPESAVLKGPAFVAALQPSGGGTRVLAIRMPAWCQSRFLQSDLQT